MTDYHKFLTLHFSADTLPRSIFPSNRNWWISLKHCTWRHVLNRSRRMPAPTVRQDWGLRATSLLVMNKLGGPFKWPYIWGFPKMLGFPNNPWGFPTKNDQHLRGEMGVPEFKETPIWVAGVITVLFFRSLYL